MYITSLFVCYNNGMLIDQVKETIQQHGLIKSGDQIVTGLSGGPDSVCLLHVLYGLRQEYNITLHAVHINHMLRGQEANEDEAYVRRLCKDLGVALECVCFDVHALEKEWGVSTEEAGRKVRYETFRRKREELLLETRFDVKIAIGQNKNDQAETLLMRILRGTGPDGLAGIEYVREEIYIRPLLDLTRWQIEEYCQEHALQPRIDRTNLEPLYHRNRIRLELIPYLTERWNPNLVENLHRLSQHAAEDKEFLRQEADRTVVGHSRKVTDSFGRIKMTIPLTILQEQHPAIAKRVLVILLHMLGLTQDIAAVHLDQAMGVIVKGRTSLVSEFPSHYKMRIRYETVELYQTNSQEQWFHSKQDGYHSNNSEKKSKQETTELKPDGRNEVSTFHVAIVARKIPILLDHQQTELWNNGVVEQDQDFQLGTSAQGFTCSLDYDQVFGVGLVPMIRSRRPGDYIVPIGMTGTKKVKKLMIDKKIPLDQRDGLAMVCLGSEVIWIPGHVVSEKFKVKPETKMVLLLEYQPEVW